MDMMKQADKGLIFNIQRFSIHDGIGIRTLIFMKGCPLKCLWCSNPESQNAKKEILFFPEKCIGCGRCFTTCASKAVDSAAFAIDRRKCRGCGVCADICAAEAKKVVGELKSVDDILSEIERDRIFYRNSNGGVTIGGGEPLAQAGFVHNLLKRCKEKNLHTAIETCGFAKWEDICDIFPFIDQVFYDLKHLDDERHKAITGVSNQLILENAKKMAALGNHITFRIPLIPNYNDSIENISKTGEFVKQLMTQNHSIKMELLEYHGLGENKYNGLDRAYALSGTKSDPTTLNQCRQILEHIGVELI